MAVNYASKALKDYRDRKDLKSKEEILLRYEEERSHLGWPEDTKVNERTLRYYATKGLIAAPIRGKYNKSRYPEKVAFDLLAIRWLQFVIGLTLFQIKDLFHGLNVGYFEPLPKLHAENKQNELREILCDYSEESRNKARLLILSCADYLDEETPTDDQIPKIVEEIYRRFNRGLFDEYLQKNGDDLFCAAMKSYSLIDNGEASIKDIAEAMFTVDMLVEINEIKQGNCSAETAWERFEMTKPITYKQTILQIKASYFKKMYGKPGTK